MNRMHIPLFYCLLAALLLCSTVSRAVEGEIPYVISVESEQTGLLSIDGKAPVFKSSPDALSLSGHGDESSQCSPYGRQSAGSIESMANIIQNDLSNGRFSAKINLQALANGGHFRTCAGCLNNHCVGIFGHDTGASVKATSRIRVKIKFNQTDPYGKYTLSVLANNDANTEINIYDSASKSPVDINPLLKLPIVDSIQGRIYFVDIETTVKAENNGGCCSEENHANLIVDFWLKRAPIMYSLDPEPYIRGGKLTDDYRSVGALLLDGNLQCTATLVGKSTLLTAAHCLSGFEGRIKDMAWVTGGVVNSPDYGPVALKRWLIHPDYQKSGYVNDIAIVYLNEDVPLDSYRIHSGEPKLADEIKNNRRLVFVGYGVTFDSKGRPTGAGSKRQASWLLDSVGPTKIAFKTSEYGTCQGDSGGPAFIQDESTFAPATDYILAGITSAGTEKCNEGFETRVEVFKEWLSSRIF